MKIYYTFTFFFFANIYNVVEKMAQKWVTRASRKCKIWKGWANRFKYIDEYKGAFPLDLLFFLFGEMRIYSPWDFYLLFFNIWWSFNGFIEKLQGEISSFLTGMEFPHHFVTSLSFPHSFLTVSIPFSIPDQSRCKEIILANDCYLRPINVSLYFSLSWWVTGVKFNTHSTFLIGRTFLALLYNLFN